MDVRFLKFAPYAKNSARYSAFLFHLMRTKLCDVGTVQFLQMTKLRHREVM